MRIGKTIVVIDVPIPAELAPLRFAPPASATEKERKESPRIPAQAPAPVAVPAKVEVKDESRA